MATFFSVNNGTELASDRDESRFDRKFSPEVSEEMDADGNFLRLSELEEEWVFPVCKKKGSDDLIRIDKTFIRMDQIFIAVYGICRGQSHARYITQSPSSFVGVYFSSFNPFNLSMRLYDRAPTPEKVELAACIYALRQVKHLKRFTFGEEPETTRMVEEFSVLSHVEPFSKIKPLTRVIIKSSSEDVVKGMTESVFTWRWNGYRNPHRKKITNSDLFRQLDMLVEDLNMMGVEVKFWHVPKASNKGAEMLAKKASNYEFQSDIMMGGRILRLHTRVLTFGNLIC
ncbi:MAG: hypothetical protein M1834_008118 [Cirrosporium novae-zelandiae]|nr:MAG: hypothetical protein M1834_008118 [Cirrosporium novae-zelandiae]